VRSKRNGLFSGLFLHCPADVDEIVADHAEPDPTLHAIFALVSAAIETVPALGHADAALTTGPPFLAVAEPTLLLLAFALRTRGVALFDDLVSAGG
jgi:hypothetical protein